MHVASRVEHATSFSLRKFIMGFNSYTPFIYDDWFVRIINMIGPRTTARLTKNFSARYKHQAVGVLWCVFTILDVSHALPCKIETEGPFWVTMV